MLASGFDLAWEISGVSDLDGGARADLVWRNKQSGDVPAWFMAGEQLKSWAMLASGLDLNWRISGIGDNNADLIWQNAQSGEVAEWLMNGPTIKSWASIRFDAP